MTARNNPKIPVAINRLLCMAGLVLYNQHPVLRIRTFWQSEAAPVDSEVVSQILQRTRRASELERLTPREREVLAALAEGLSNKGIADKLTISPGAVEKHISNVFTKLDLTAEDHIHRRVLAVLTYLA